jgi:4'-phosphopantetheinyl transferase
MIGYHLAWENSLIGMVMVQGKQREVVNIGLGIKQVAVEPRDATVSAYVESLSHKVRATRFPTTRLPWGKREGTLPPSP